MVACDSPESKNKTVVRVNLARRSTANLRFGTFANRQQPLPSSHAEGRGSLVQVLDGGWAAGRAWHAVVSCRREERCGSAAGSLVWACFEAGRGEQREPTAANSSRHPMRPGIQQPHVTPRRSFPDLRLNPLPPGQGFLSIPSSFLHHPSFPHHHPSQHRPHFQHRLAQSRWPSPHHITPHP